MRTTVQLDEAETLYWSSMTFERRTPRASFQVSDKQQRRLSYDRANHVRVPVQFKQLKKVHATAILTPVEIKSGETVAASFFDGLQYFTSLGAPAATTGVVVHGGDAMYQRGGFTVRPWYACG